MARSTAAAALAFTILAAQGSLAPTAALESPWLDGYKTRTRLLAGSAGEPARRLAFVEIEMPDGWKTYWRNPGDAGGLPPAFDWGKSENLAAANVLYPAPHRLSDRSGDTIGYKARVIFPVEVTATDPGQPIALAVRVAYGICKDICVPVEAELALEVPAGTLDAAPPAAVTALEAVPRGEGERRPTDPELTRAAVRRDGAVPRLVLETAFPGDASDADVFLYAPDGLYVPMPARTADLGGGKLTFEAELGDDVDLEALKGKPVTATLVGKTGASTATFKIE